jgi:hypothetical protein
MLCMLYVTALTATLGIIAALLEPTLPETAPRRWLWFIPIILSVTIPPLYIANHYAVVTRTAVGDTSIWSHLSMFDAEIRGVWLVAVITLALWGIVSAARLAWLLPKRGRSIVIHPTLGPATIGVLRTRVVLPAWLLALPYAQQRDILHHEYEHKRAHDTQLLFIASLSVVIAPWNIALWWLLQRLRLAVEIDCDNRVLARRGDASTYGELLLNVAARSGASTSLQPAFLGSASMLERRLRHMLAPRQLSRAQRIVLASMALVMLTLALATPHPVLRSRVERSIHAGAHR